MSEERMKLCLDHMVIGARYVIVKGGRYFAVGDRVMRKADGAIHTIPYSAEKDYSQKILNRITVEVELDYDYHQKQMKSLLSKISWTEYLLRSH